MNFAKHETFHIRDGWLYKGLAAIEADPAIFLNDGAPEVLGLGKNMVRALRYWMQATGLADEVFNNRTKEQSPTIFGRLVRTYDPYLENDGTLWLIHYYLVSSDLATSWYWFFNLFAPVEFTKDEFVDRLDNWIGLQDENARVSNKSLQKDFDCLTRMYLPSSQDKSPEDQLESPLTELGLLSVSRELNEEGKRIHHYRLHKADIQNVPALAFLFILLDRQEKERPGSTQVDLNQALREPGNVGRVLNIGMRDIEDFVLKLEDEAPEGWQVRLTRTANLNQLTLPPISSQRVLCFYYSQNEEESCL